MGPFSHLVFWVILALQMIYAAITLQMALNLVKNMRNNNQDKIRLLIIRLIVLQKIRVLIKMMVIIKLH